MGTLLPWGACRHSRRLTFAAGVLLAVVTGSCGFANVVNADIPVKAALVRDGFLDVDVGHSPGFPSTGQPVKVTVVTSGTKAELSGSAPSGDVDATAAKDVWDTFPYQFDSVSITVVGSAPEVYSAAQLADTFGPRASGTGSRTLAQSVAQGYDEVFAVLGILVALLVVHVVRVELRKRRIHADRRQEIALAHQRVHMGAHQLDMWSGTAAAAPHVGASVSGPTGPQHSGGHVPGPTGPSHGGAPAPAHGAPLPTVPHVDTPWTGHASPPHPGPPPVGIGDPAPGQPPS